MLDLTAVDDRSTASVELEGAAGGYAALVATANDVPALVKEVERLRAAVDAVRSMHQPRSPSTPWDLAQWQTCSCGALGVTTAVDGDPSLGPVAYDECPTVKALNIE